jgi:hypothetical protein
MFSLHSSIANFIIVQVQHLSDCLDIETPNWWLNQKTRKPHLLPRQSALGGDIFLLPDVVALFSKPIKK